jgi:uncharacterized membrane protein YcgQ (UPF0703/DUF1980 family)
MSETKATRNSLIIAVVIFAVTASFFTFNYVKTKKTIENFNAALGKEDKSGFFQVAGTIANDNKFGTFEENVQFAKVSPNKGIIEIKERMFATQVNDVYLNADDYLGKTIKLEGLFKQDEGYDKTYSFVIRYGPGGCCGLDANVGFEVVWAEEQAKPYPKIDSWVEAVGVLKTYEEDKYMQYLYLDLSSLNVLSRRGGGAETVRQ